MAALLHANTNHMNSSACHIYVLLGSRTGRVPLGLPYDNTGRNTGRHDNTGRNEEELLLLLMRIFFFPLLCLPLLLLLRRAALVLVACIPRHLLALSLPQ